MTAVLDLFAGPGGLDLAAQALGMSPVGIERDPVVCATRRAAGLRIGTAVPPPVGIAVIGEAAGGDWRPTHTQYPTHLHESEGM